jgi:hypothetical protein
MSDRVGEQFILMLRSLIGCDHPESEDSVHYADFARELPRPPFLPHGWWGLLLPRIQLRVHTLDQLLEQLVVE